MKASKKPLKAATKSRNISYLNEAETSLKIYNTSALIYNAGGGVGNKIIFITKILFLSFYCMNQIHTTKMHNS